MDPINLVEALTTFDALWSPHVVTTVNDHDVRVAKVRGEHLWHAHDDADEFFLVLEGELDIALEDRTVHLTANDVFVVPKGARHKPSSPTGARILMIEPSGTSTVGDRHEEVPDHVDATAGHPLSAP
jgi:mannose-6-phosphate isomerase-like protein (cupin superfamily)